MVDPAFGCPHQRALAPPAQIYEEWFPEWYQYWLLPILGRWCVASYVGLASPVIAHPLRMCFCIALCRRKERNEVSIIEAPQSFLEAKLRTLI